MYEGALRWTLSGLNGGLVLRTPAREAKEIRSSDPTCKSVGTAIFVAHDLKVTVASGQLAVGEPVASNFFVSRECLCQGGQVEGPIPSRRTILAPGTTCLGPVLHRHRRWEQGEAAEARGRRRAARPERRRRERSDAGRGDDAKVRSTLTASQLPSRLPPVRPGPVAPGRRRQAAQPPLATRPNGSPRQASRPLAAPRDVR